MFQRFVKRIGSKCEVADGKAFEYGATKVKISVPVPHGEEGTELGWVLMTSVESNEDRLLHASDVQGPMSDVTAHLIVQEKPSVLILGGPPGYLQGVRVDEASIRKGMKNASHIAGQVPTTIFEHHVLRSENWTEEAREVFEEGARQGHEVLTAAQYLKEPPRLLEMRRRRLYEEEPPSEEFVKWTELGAEKRRQQSPPV